MPPVPAPMRGKAMEWYPAFLATINAFLVANRTDSSEGIHKWPIPATCMMPLRGKRPAPVKTACPRASVLYFRSSQNGATPDFFLIAPETPWGNNNHHGIRLRFHALTMTSTFWSRRSPVMIFGFIFSWLTSALSIEPPAAGGEYGAMRCSLSFLIQHSKGHLGTLEILTSPHQCIGSRGLEQVAEGVAEEKVIASREGCPSCITGTIPENEL